MIQAHNQISTIQKLIKRGYSIMEKSIAYQPSKFGIFCKGVVVLVGAKGARSVSINCKDETTAIKLYIESAHIN